MDNLSIYCMCLDDDYLGIVKKLNYIPVGLKNKNFSDGWLLDNTLENISEKDFKKLHDERKKVYSLADFKINCDFKSKDQIVEEIKKIYENI